LGKMKEGLLGVPNALSRYKKDWKKKLNKVKRKKGNEAGGEVASRNTLFSKKMLAGVTPWQKKKKKFVVGGSTAQI